MKKSGSRSGRKLSCVAGIQTQKALNSVFSIAKSVFPEVLVRPLSAGLFLESLETRCLLSAIDVELVAVSAASAGDEWTDADIGTLPNKISTVTRGQTFYVETWIRNDDGSTNGIFGGCIDIDFGTNPAMVTGDSISHGGIYTSLKTGTINNSTMVVDKFGGAVDPPVPPQFSKGANEWVRLGYVAFTAASDTSGTVGFSAGPFDTLPFGRIDSQGVPEDIDWADVELNDPPLSVTVTDQVAVPEISIDDVTLAEGDSGTTVFEFTVSLSQGLIDEIVSVNYTTANGTETDGEDYTAITDVLIFMPGETEQKIEVFVNGDNMVEPDEAFFVNLSNAIGGVTISDSQGIGTITNDDDSVVVTINDVTLAEGDSGTTVFEFYGAANGILIFMPGETEQKIEVLVNGDTTVEPDETFFVNLSNTVGGIELGDNQGEGTITNDDLPGLSIDSVAVTEGNSGTVSAGFTVTLSAESSQTVTVSYNTGDGTGDDAAVADNDYVSKSGTVTFEPGVLQQTIFITVNGDTDNESNETFFVNLSSPSNAVWCC